MEHPFLQELTGLLRETEELLASADPDTERLEEYGRAREAKFARMNAAGASIALQESERAALANLIRKVLERDRLLMQRLEEYLAHCRAGLSGVRKAGNALNGYHPAPSPTFVRRHA